MKVQRGDVVLTRVPHAAGGRGKKRPAVVVQADVYNQSERHTLVAEIASNLKKPGDRNQGETRGHTELFSAT